MPDPQTPPSPETAPGTTSERVARVLREHPLVDGHNDLPWELRERVGGDLTRVDVVDLVRGEPGLCTDLPRLRQGMVGAQFWSVYVPSNLPGHEAVTATLEQVELVHRLVAAHGDVLGLALTADDVDRVVASGRVASLLGAEGGQSIGCSLGTLRVLHALGVRYLTLTHNDNTPWADSATDEPVLGGLSAFGRDVVRELNRVGMMVDLSHVSPATMHAALDVSRAPVLFSHSGARAVTDVVRNVPDDVLLRVRDTGGTVMVALVPEFLNDDVAAWRAETADLASAEGVDPKDFPSYQRFAFRRQQTHPKPQASLQDAVRHLEHVREVAGVDAVGIGGDYDGTDTYPVGLEDVTGYPRLLAALADRGWSDEDLAKVAGRNALRVLRDAEAVARDLQATTSPVTTPYDVVDLTAR